MRDWPFSEALLGHPHAAHDPCIAGLDTESMEKGHALVAPATLHRPNVWASAVAQCSQPGDRRKEHKPITS